MFFDKRHYSNLTKDDIGHTEWLIIFTRRETEGRGSQGICKNMLMESIKMKLKEIMGEYVD
jgi:hypothetical protein